MKNLLLGNPLASSSQLQEYLSTLKTNETDFEQPHRLSSLPSNSYSTITSAIPPFKTLDSAVLKGCLLALVPNGTIIMTELMTREKQSSLNIPSISQRKSELIMAGFTSIEILREELVSVSDLSHLEYDEQASKDMMLKVTLKACKPDFVVGASAKLSFGKNSKKIWKISALQDDNDDLEIENDESLLDEEDLKLPSKTMDSNCETKKKRCKNCTCGRLEEEYVPVDSVVDDLNNDLNNKITIVESTITKKNLPVSSCGSCYLGDAFRCSTCPYLGMPAFKEGEKVQLSGNLLADDY